MKIKNYQVTQLEKMLNPLNPRWIKEEDFKSLQTSLTEFGCVEPIVVNIATGRVVGGHQRIKSAIALKKKELPVVEIEVTEEKELALNLGLNKISGEWDYEKLGKVLAEIETELTGFSLEEVNNLLVETPMFEEMEYPENLEYPEQEETEYPEQGEETEQIEEEETEKEEVIKIKFGIFEKRVNVSIYENWILALEQKEQLAKDIIMERINA
jgi:ParB-like chromosome segregation protein Spo0J